MALKSNREAESWKKARNSPPADWEPMPAAYTRTATSRGIHMDIVGLEGQGKSSLALTLSRLGAIGYVDIDQSVDRAHRPPKKQMEKVRRLPLVYAVAPTEEETKRICGEAWVNMERKVRSAAEDWAKGIVIDTGTEDWEVIRLGSFGTLTPRAKRMDRLYGPVNAKYRTHLRSVNRQARKHLVTIHQLKDEYIDRKQDDGTYNSVRTGKHQRAGFKEIGYLADITVRVHRKGDNFAGTIDMCKLAPNGPSLEGFELDEDQLDFLTIVCMATDTEEGDWIK